MNDFDFEELDKAVTALGTKTEKELGGPAPEPVTRPNVAPVSMPEAKEAQVKPDEQVLSEQAPVVSEPSKRRLDAAPKRRGSFMDIVTPNTARRAPARVGVSIQPLSKAEDIVPSQQESEPATLAAEPVAEKTPTIEDAVESISKEETQKVETEPDRPKPQPEASPDDVAWPDPLDFGAAPLKDEKPAEPASPFLAEAKVEKRPLGAFSDYKPEFEAPAVDDLPEPEKAPLPSLEDKPISDEPEQPEAAAERAPLPPLDEKAEKIVAKPDLHDTAMMSIPQQYRTETQPTDKAVRPIFDTKEYHPPLIEATSHDHRGGGSMWGKIFIAFVVLALLAVGGFFAYIYFVQQ